MLLRETAEKTARWVNSWAIELLLVVPIALFLFGIVAYTVDPNAVTGSLMMLVALSPIWLPAYLFVAFWVTWMNYIRFLFWRNQEMVLLEIQLPPEVEKSPLAMELFFVALWNSGGETTFIHRIWKGQFRPIWTLEIAGNGGRVTYYLHLRRVFKDIVEARLYGQFPEVRVVEAEDYAAKIPFNTDEYELFGVEYEKGTVAALPIRTYVDYGMHENTDKPEIQIDPITNILELLSSMNSHQYFWLQIVIKARKKDEWYGFYYTADRYKNEGLKKIKEITEGAIKRTQEFIKDDSAKAQAASRSTTLLTEGERRQVDAIERSLTKLVFECGIRTLYFSKKEHFYGPHIPNLIRFFDAYRYPGFNSLGVTRGLQQFDYPWQDFANIRKNKIKRNMFKHYKQRAYFYVPYDQAPVFMTTEELATLWHFPSSVVKTPGLDRVPSRRAEAPPNLPTLPT